VFHLVERYRLTLAEVPVEVVNSSRSTVHVVRDAARLVRDLFRVRRHALDGGYELREGERPPTLDGEPGGHPGGPPGEAAQGPPGGPSPGHGAPQAQH
jgi:hypothetical protein